MIMRTLRYDVTSKLTPVAHVAYVEGGGGLSLFFAFYLKHYQRLCVGSLEFSRAYLESPYWLRFLTCTVLATPTTWVGVA